MTKALIMGTLIACTAGVLAATADQQLDPVARAGTHPIVRERPGPDFFEGALAPQRKF